MATSPITAKIFAGEALNEAEKRALTQEQEWLHVLLQAGISNIRTWAEFKGHAIWRCFIRIDRLSPSTTRYTKNLCSTS